MDPTVSSAVNTYVPLIGGIGTLCWLIYRLFWKVDRRSQQDLAIRDQEIKDLNVALDKEKINTAKERDLRIAEVNNERSLRFASEERAAKAEAREGSLESRISDLSDQLDELRKEVLRLRTQLNINAGQPPTPAPA